MPVTIKVDGVRATITKQMSIECDDPSTLSLLTRVLHARSDRDVIEIGANPYVKAIILVSSLQTEGHCAAVISYVLDWDVDAIPRSITAHVQDCSGHH